MGQLLFKGHIVIKCWTYVGHVRSCPGLDYGLLYGFPKAYMMYMYVCIYMYMYVCMYACMCVYIYIMIVYVYVFMYSSVASCFGESLF